MQGKTPIPTEGAPPRRADPDLNSYSAHVVIGDIDVDRAERLVAEFPK